MKQDEDKISLGVKSQNTYRTRAYDKLTSHTRNNSKPSPECKYPPSKVIFKSTKKLTTFKSFHLTPLNESGGPRSREYISPLKLKQIEKSLGIDMKDKETC